MSKIRPIKIGLEASSFCQLKCPSCPTTSKAIHPAVGSGFLSLRNFQRLLDENPWLEEIELSNYGEIFLNPDLLNITKFAYERDVALKADNGVNLNNVKESVLEGLVKYKFRSITCSIDGSRNETYNVYRVKGNFETVIENIRKINLFKQKYQSEYPILNWQFVVFGHNEHEIPLARKLAGELDMKFSPKLSWDPKFSPSEIKNLLGKKLVLPHEKNSNQSMRSTTCKGFATNFGISRRSIGMVKCWGAVAISGVTLEGMHLRMGFSRVSTMRRLNTLDRCFWAKKVRERISLVRRAIFTWA